MVGWRVAASASATLCSNSEAGIPDADAVASLELDRRITGSWLEAAPEVVMSYPRREDEREIEPSPLIVALPEVPEVAFDLPRFVSLRDAITLSAHVESVADFQAPALPVSDRARRDGRAGG